MKNFTLFLALVFLQLTAAQDLHISQIQNANILLNPALSACNNDVELASGYRHQWKGSKQGFESMIASAAIAFNRSKKPAQGYFALGAHFHQNRSGVHSFVQQSSHIALAYHLNLNSYSNLSTAVYLGHFGLGTDTQQGRWGSQHDGFVYNPQLASGEMAFQQFRSFMDAGAGIVYSLNQQNNLKSPERKRIIQAGVSCFHLNRPDLSFSMIQSNRLPIRFTGFANAIIRLKEEIIALKPAVYYQQQGAFKSVYTGMDVEFLFSEKMKETSSFGKKQQQTFTIGLFMRYNDALVSRAEFRHNNLALGYSFDFNFSSYRTASQSYGASEIFVRFIVGSIRN